jgi:flagellar biosynthesis/type III secretory pathway ATPase
MDATEEAFAARLVSSVARVAGANIHGRVSSSIGTLVRATGASARIGELCLLQQLGGTFSLPAEVVGFDGEELLLTPMGDTQGLHPGLAVVALGRAHRIGVGDAMLGRVYDGLGRCISEQPGPALPQQRSVRAAPPPPLQRPLVAQP